MRKMLWAQATVGEGVGEAATQAGKEGGEVGEDQRGEPLEEELVAVAWTRCRAWVGVWLCPLICPGKFPPLSSSFSQTGLPTPSRG